jgi:phenylpropionate dioxygenase-like ring-hydroxylating dioxygenase large terminal subunit
MNESRPASTAAPLARGLPPHWYASAEIYALELERLFRREWTLIGRADEVANPGDFLCLEVFGEPLMMIRGEDGAVRVLSRVCRHRSMPVLEGCGNVPSIVCPYHAWRYGLDGRLLAAPEMKRAPELAPDRCRLPEIHSEQWEGFVFVNFDQDAAPLAPALAGLASALRNNRLADMRTVRGAPFEGGCAWNWKLMCDNFIEPYHHLGAHRRTLEPIMPARSAYALRSDGPWSVVRMPFRPEKSPFVNGVHARSGLPALPALDPEERDSLTAVHIFPCSLISMWGTHAEFYRCFPREAGRFDLEKHFCLPHGMQGGGAIESGIDWLVENFIAFRDEDIDICRAVQRGLASRFAEAGRLCDLEEPIGRFARYIETRMGTAPAAS